MKKASNLNFSDEEDNSILKLVRLMKNLGLMQDDYKRLEYLETKKSVYEECAHYCNLQIKKIIKLNKYKKKFKENESEEKRLVATNEIRENVPDTVKNILSEISKSENKFWKGLPMEKVVEHFRSMTTKKNKNNDLFLTIDQLISFLKKGFLNDTTQPKQKINCSANEKGFIIKRFYQLYDLSVAQYGHPAKKAKFISLFADCFDNWDKDTVATFFKPHKVKENW